MTRHKWPKEAILHRRNWTQNQGWVKNSCSQARGCTAFISALKRQKQPDLLVSLRPSWSTYWVWGHLRLPREVLSQGTPISDNDKNSLSQAPGTPPVNPENSPTYTLRFRPRLPSSSQIKNVTESSENFTYSGIHGRNPRGHHHSKRRW